MYLEQGELTRDCALGQTNQRPLAEGLKRAVSDHFCEGPPDTEMDILFKMNQKNCWGSYKIKIAWRSCSSENFERQKGGDSLQDMKGVKESEIGGVK